MIFSHGNEVIKHEDMKHEESQIKPKTSHEHDAYVMEPMKASREDEDMIKLA